MILKELKNPFLLLMVGVPLSGKSTWLRENISDDIDVVVISRDQIIMDLYGSDNYNEAYANVDSKAVDKLLYKTIMDAYNDKSNVILDMVNVTKKRRNKSLSYFRKSYTKVALVFPVLDMDVYALRNSERIVNENKRISKGVMDMMIESYVYPTIDEGFDLIIDI